MLGMIKFCLASLRERFARTALITGSIAIGVTSVLMIGVIGDNGVALINNELDSLGVGGVSISRPEAELSEYFTNRELEQIKQTPYVESATPILTATGYLKDAPIERAIVCGIDETAKSVISVNTVLGEKIGYKDVVGRNNVCQIDEKTAKELFSKRNPIGQTIDLFLGGSIQSFEVIGIVSASSNLLQTSLGDLIPNFIYIPFTTLQAGLGSEKIDRIAVTFSPQYDNDFCISRLTEQMDSKDLYSAKLLVEDLNKQRDSLNGILSIVTMVMRIIGGVSLIVSGLGVMTVMLISVSEKTKEIGIKKSIGANKRDIVFEFLFESTTLSMLGCIVGVVFSYILTLIGKIVFSFQFAISFENLLLTLTVAFLCGIVFGVYPAIKAANLKPITALRVE